MGLAQVRGGIPHVFRADIDITGRKHTLPFYTNYLKIRASGSPCRVYFTQANFDADEDYVYAPMPSASQPYGEWDGPVEADDIWLKGEGGTSTVELVAFQRRG